MPADITNLVVEPLDGSTVVVGVPYRLRAEAVQANGELFDATDKVDWGATSTGDYDIAADGLTITFKADASESVTLTATPNDDSFGEYATPATSTVTVLKPEVQGIIVTPPDVTLAEKEVIQLRAYEYYTYGKPLDVTSAAVWSVEGTGDGDLGVTVSDDGLVTSLNQGGTVNITAKKEGNEGSTLVFILEACGSGEADLDNINDTDATNAIGACLKIASDSSGNWFTSTPSQALMDAMGYKEDDSSINSGDTYSVASSDAIGGNFAEFRQDGIDVILPGAGGDSPGVNGQFDRWCQRLALLGFADRSDWHRPLAKELTVLHGDVGSLSSGFGWPTGSASFSATEDGEGYVSVFLDGGTESTRPASYQDYASCISSP
ncbi:hypothetical protein BTO01_23070 [Vibrio jasicida]|nr:hypothetical protein BTO01_23070 [Vibrio jasicida]